MTASRLARAFVFTANVERMAAFYAGAFGMRREPNADPGFVLMSGTAGADMAIHALPPDVAANVTVVSPPRWRDDTAYKICFSTDDLLGQRQKVLDHGGQAKDPWTWEGTQYCECTDPDGNVVQIFQHPEP